MPEPGETALTRRELLRRAAAGAAVLGLGSLRGEAAEAPAPRAKVVLVREAAAIDAAGRVDPAVVESMLSLALCSLTGATTAVAAWGRYVTARDRVGIKTTLMMTPTHPELLRAICRGLTGAGVPDTALVTWDRNRSGVGVGEVASLPRGVEFGREDVSEAVWQSTRLINAPALKSHWLAGVACALKNWAGAVTRINTRDENVAYAFHADSCRETGVLNAIPAIRDRCRLHIADALRPLCHGGPQVDPRYRWEYKGLLVSTDPVALDTIGVRILEGKRRQLQGAPWPLSPPVTHLAVAEGKYHLGVADPTRIDLVKIGLDTDSFV